MPSVSHNKYPAEMFYYDFQASMHGTKVFKVARPGIHWNSNEWSHVLVTATEFNRNPAVFLGVDNFVGSARVVVSNIAVREGEVHIRIDVDWPSDLLINVRMHVITMKLQAARQKPKELEIQTGMDIEPSPKPKRSGKKRVPVASGKQGRTKR